MADLFLYASLLEQWFLSAWRVHLVVYLHMHWTKRQWFTADIFNTLVGQFECHSSLKPLMLSSISLFIEMLTSCKMDEKTCILCVILTLPSCDEGVWRGLMSLRVYSLIIKSLQNYVLLLLNNDRIRSPFCKWDDHIWRLALDLGVQEYCIRVWLFRPLLNNTISEPVCADNPFVRQYFGMVWDVKT